MNRQAPDRDAIREWSWIGAMMLAGGLVRVIGLARAGVDHFDEGIYALVCAGWWQGDTLSPELIAYAPPGYPWLGRLAMGIVGPSELALFAVSALTGTLTIGLAGGMGRRWLGSGAGAVAATLAAWSGHHLAFSRTALTDASFLLAWVVGLHMAARWAERPTWGRAVMVGLAAAAAQYVKYNGWLLGPIAVAAAGWCLWRRPKAERSWGRWLGGSALAGLTGAVAYWPWYRFVETNGGYAALLRHHADYVLGPMAWADGWLAQLEQARALAGPWGWIVFGALLATGGLALAVPPRGLRSGVRFGLAAVVALLGVAVPGWEWALALLLVGGAIRTGQAGLTVLATTWVVFGVLTPMYHPYARLWLPTVALGWFASAALMSALARGEDRGHWVASRWAWVAVMVAIACAVVVAETNHRSARAWTRMGEPIGAPRDDMRRALRAVAEESGTRRPLAVFGRPILVWELGRAGVPVRRVGSLEEWEQDVRIPILIDDAVLGATQAQAADAISARGWAPNRVWTVSNSIVSALDRDPSRAIRPGEPNESQLLLVVPR